MQYQALQMDENYSRLFSISAQKKSDRYCQKRYEAIALGKCGICFKNDRENLSIKSCKECRRKRASQIKLKRQRMKLIW